MAGEGAVGATDRYKARVRRANGANKGPEEAAGGRGHRGARCSLDNLREVAPTRQGGLFFFTPVSIRPPLHRRVCSRSVRLLFWLVCFACAHLRRGRGCVDSGLVDAGGEDAVEVEALRRDGGPRPVHGLPEAAAGASAAFAGLCDGYCARDLAVAFLRVGRGVGGRARLLCALLALGGKARAPPYCVSFAACALGTAAGARCKALRAGALGSVCTVPSAPVPTVLCPLWLRCASCVAQHASQTLCSALSSPRSRRPRVQQPP